MRGAKTARISLPAALFSTFIAFGAVALLFALHTLGKKLFADTPLSFLLLPTAYGLPFLATLQGAAENLYQVPHAMFEALAPLLTPDQAALLEHGVVSAVWKGVIWGVPLWVASKLVTQMRIYLPLMTLVALAYALSHNAGTVSHLFVLLPVGVAAGLLIKWTDRLWPALLLMLVASIFAAA